MFIPKSALFLGILLAVLLEPISGRRGFGGGHSYPKSGGLSGGGHHSSGGLSGGGHGYPSSGGSHAYPSSGGSHARPPSGGSHGYPSSGGMSGSSGSHGYPSSGGSSGSHGYPSSGGGLSGNSHGYPNKPGTGHHTTINNHYHYSPPPQISYAPVRGAPAVNYPVYHGNPPTYVYQYKNSGSKYGTLLAGLALLNLGTLGAVAYAHSGGHSSQTYKAQPGEVCKFAVQKDNGDYEETKIDCQIISSFILQDQAQTHNTGTNSTVSMITVTNTTVMNTTNMMPDQTSTPGPVTPALGNVLYAMLPNGTLVPVNTTAPGVPGLPGSPMNVTHNETGVTSPSGGVVTSSVVTTTTTNTTLVNALDVKGKAVEVTPGMKCFVIRHSPTSNMKKTVPCGLLQTYADKSIRRSSAARNGPMFTILAAIIAFCVAY